jgi:hypothetical protein
MPTPAGNSTAQSATAALRLSALQAVGLQVLPGVPALVVYLVLAALLGRQGLPALLALYLAILLAEVPASWFIMAYLTRKEQGRVSLANLFPWRRRLRRWQYLLIGLPLAIVSVIIMGALQPTLAESLRLALFGWVPGWAIMDMSVGFEGLSGGVLFTIWALGLVSATLVGGVTQELYARGFLLPRTAHLGAIAPVLNAAAFALLHLPSPWAWPVFFLVSLPWAIAVYRTRSVQLGLVGHVGMLLVIWLGMTALVLRGS